jgi:hypothetical protein
VTLRPVRDLEVIRADRHPDTLARVLLRLRDEPAWPVRRLAPLLARLARRALELLLLNLEVVRTLVPAEFERTLVRAHTAVGWAHERA